MKFFEFFPFISFLLFSILIFGRTFFLKRKGIQVDSKSGNSRKMKLILHPVFLVIMHLWIFEISKPIFHISLLPEMFTNNLIQSFVIQVTGTIFIVISLGLLIATLFSFRDSFRLGMNSNNLGKLITTGIFKISRNPFFVSVEFFFVGNALIFGNLFLIVFAILTIVSIHFFILKEEKFLRENYGDEYKKYAKKVGRYFLK